MKKKNVIFLDQPQKTFIQEPILRRKFSKYSTLLNSITSIQRHLNSSKFNFKDFMFFIAEQVQSCLFASGVAIELIHGTDTKYQIALGDICYLKGLSFSIDGSITGICLKTHHTIYAHNVNNDASFHSPDLSTLHVSSFVISPLLYSGCAVGALKVVSKKKNMFTAEDIHLVQIMSGFITIGMSQQISQLENKKLLDELSLSVSHLKSFQERILHLLTYDLLTNLPNRRLFMERLEEALARSDRARNLVALLFIDIDYFKAINDDLGHDVGDELLKHFAKRLRGSVRRYDVVARMEGDDFLILSDDLNSLNNAIKIVKNILVLMQKPFYLKEHVITISVSIGLTLTKNEEMDSVTFLKQAERALHLAKKSGRNTFRIYLQSPGMYDLLR